MLEEDQSSSAQTTNLVPKPNVFRQPPYERIDEFLAPLRVDCRGNPADIAMRPWEGIAKRKPWHYRVVAGIVHMDQPEMLEVVIETLRMQTERPFIHVVDTGSNHDVCWKLRKLELSCDDVRIDYLHPRGWSQTSAPVATAMDLVFASVDYGVDYVYSTHVDVFLKSRKYLEYLIGRCDEDTPVVGYRMSPRKMTDLWKIIPSHTATLYFMPVMRAIRAQWSMHAAAQRLGLTPEVFRHIGGWPDTETNLGLDLRDAGIGMRMLNGKPGVFPTKTDGRSWLCIGDESNEPYDTAWLRHERSFPSQSLYSPEHAAERQGRVDRTLAETRERIERWKNGVME